MKSGNAYLNFGGEKYVRMALLKEAEGIIERQQQEIGRMKNRVEFCERMSKDAKTEIVHLQNELVKSGEEIERLRRALEFYADKQNYVANVVDQWEPVVPIIEDCGEKAREALEGRK